MGEVQSRLLQPSDVPEYTPDKILRNLKETVLKTHESVDVTKSLVKASSRGDEAMVRELLRDHMADVDGVYFGDTALHAASYNGHVEVIEILLNCHVYVEKSKENGDRAMHLAAYGDRPDVVKMLHEAGADLNARNKQMTTPLHIGINKKHVRVVRTLINLGCNVNVQDLLSGNTPLHDAIRKEQFNMVYMLLKQGAGVTKANIVKVYPLHIAAQIGNVGIVSLLVAELKEERFVDERDKNGDTALHLAANKDHVEVVELLIDVGKAHMNLQNNSLITPLHLAVKEGHTQVIDLLVGKGCNVNLQDEKGDAPLHYAVRHYGMFKNNSPDIATRLSNWAGLTHLNLSSSISVIRLLRANGADINRRNNAGQTPLDLPCGRDLLVSERFRRPIFTNK